MINANKKLPSGPDMPVRVAQVGETQPEDESAGESEAYLRAVDQSITEALLRLHKEKRKRPNR